MYILILCEKHTGQALPIAKTFNLTQEQDCYTGEILGRKACVVSASGHLFELQQPCEASENYSWNDPSTLLPIPAHPSLVIKKSTGKTSPSILLSNIKKRLTGASQVILATDPDREGEAIGWNILTHLNNKLPVKRLWLDRGLDETHIRKAFQQTLPCDQTKPLLYAQNARQYSDWGWQYLLTAYTYYARSGALGDALSDGIPTETVVPIGRVQLCMLRLIVERHLSIISHQPVTYYPVSVEANLGKSRIEGFHFSPKTTPDGLPFGFEEVNNRVVITDPFIAHTYTQELNNCNAYAIHSTSEKPFIERPPLPHSLTSLQKTLNEKRRFRSIDVRKLSRQLYQKGLISYPGTDSRLIPSQDYAPSVINPILNAAGAFSELSKAVDYFRDRHEHFERMPSFYTKESANHFAIVPTGKAPDLGSLSPQEQIVLTEIFEAYLIAHLAPASGKTIEVTLKTDVPDPLGSPTSFFRKTIKNYNNFGYHAVISEEHAALNSVRLDVSNLRHGAPVQHPFATYREAHTSPPRHYTESTLWTVMTNPMRHIKSEVLRRAVRNTGGIGTAETRATILEKLDKRHMLDREMMALNGTLVPRQKAIQLVESLPEELANVETTALWEHRLHAIETAKSEKNQKLLCDEFVAEQRFYVERHIKLLNDKYNPKLSSTTSTRSSIRPVSEAMKARLEAIALALHITIPEATYSDYEQAKRLIAKHSQVPTLKQLKLLKRLEKQGKNIPPGAYTNIKLATQSISRSIEGGTHGSR